MSTEPRPSGPSRKFSAERLSVFVIVIVGTLALSILAWAASLPDGVTN